MWQLVRRLLGSGYDIRPITAQDAASDFQTSRQPELAAFLREKAWRDEERGFGRTFVMPAKRNADPPILGYYTLAMNRLGKDDFPAAEQSNLLYSAQPVAMLQNIARDERVGKDRRLGELLMVDALKRADRIARDIGCLGIGLFAMNEGLQGYYAGYGFKKLERKTSAKNPSQLMFLPMATLRANLPNR